jgi:hypothetical protein
VGVIALSLEHWMLPHSDFNNEVAIYMSLPLKPESSSVVDSSRDLEFLIGLDNFDALP